MQKGPLGQDWHLHGSWGWDHVSEQFVKARLPSNHGDPDRFIKERISFVELAMRLRGGEIAELNARLPQTLADAALRERMSRDDLDASARRSRWRSAIAAT
jgi:hypothetical protein